MAAKFEIKELEAAVEQAVKTLDKLGRTSEKLVRAGAGVLISVAFGLTFFLIAYFITWFSHSFSVALLGPAFLMLGLVIGALVFIGPSRIRQDRLNEALRSRNLFILEQIKSLPRNAPAELTNALWLQLARNISAHFSPAAAPIETAFKVLPPPALPPQHESPEGE